MAYLPPTNFDALRERFLGESPGISSAGAPGVPAATGGAGTGGASAPPVVGTGRFAALRGFLDANQGQANEAAGALAGSVEAKANEAVKKTGAAAPVPGNWGGRELAGEAASARDEALDAVNASRSVEGVGGLIDRRGADYTPGMRGADAMLYSRAPAVRDLSRWAPVLEALNPTNAPDWHGPIPLPGAIGYDPRASDGLSPLRLG